MNISQLKRLVRKLRISNQSIVLIKKFSEDGVNETNLARELVKAIEQSHLSDVFVIVLEDFDNIATYDVTMMNKMGWFRKEQLLALFKKISSGKHSEERTEDGKSGSV